MSANSSTSTLSASSNSSHPSHSPSPSPSPTPSEPEREREPERLNPLPLPAPITSLLSHLPIPSIPLPLPNSDRYARLKGLPTKEEMRTKKGAPLTEEREKLIQQEAERLREGAWLDAPARAALNLPNSKTLHRQALAIRHPSRFTNPTSAPLMTPEFELGEDNTVRALNAAAREVQASGSGSGSGNTGNGPLLSVTGVTPEGSSDGEDKKSGSGRSGNGSGSGRSGVGSSPGGNDYFGSGASSSLNLHGMGGGLLSSPRLGDGNAGFAIGDGWTSSRAPSRSPSPSSSTRPEQQGLLRRIFIDRSSSPSQHLTRPTFPPPSLSTYSPQPPRALSLFDRGKLFVWQSISMALSTVFLGGVVLWAVTSDFYNQLPRMLRGKKKKKTFPWDDEKYWRKNEKVSREPRDYARAVGMDIEDETIETEDGYYLRVHKVIDPDARKHSDGKGGYPVLILHGLFQSSGSFITSEERSLAFWLAKQGGYQVYLGNCRGVFGMGHRNFSRSDPRFWDWTIRELGMYDLPALVNHVLHSTGYKKLAYIGHSQGNGLAFISLSLGMVPDLGKKMSLFVALAPAVYAGPLTHGFPFTQLGKIEWPMWKRMFGVLDFIPLMRIAADSRLIPARIFATLGYIMFAFLFSWTDANWLHRRKIKMFRFTPTPVSSASIFWWCGKGGFADRKCTLDDTLDRWYDERFPPLSIYYGGKDYLVLCEPLLERLEKKEGIKPVRVEKLDISEHCDFYWAAEAVELVFMSLKETIEQTRLRYPEEIEAEAQAKASSNSTSNSTDPQI